MLEIIALVSYTTEPMSSKISMKGYRNSGKNIRLPWLKRRRMPRLQEKAEHLLSHIPAYDGHEGSSGIKFISLADEFMHNNDETCHRMITALTSRFTPDSVAAHWHEAHVMRTVPSYWVGDDNKRPQGVKTYAFTNDMQGWYEFRNHFLARFTSELESVQLRIRLGKIS